MSNPEVRAVAFLSTRWSVRPTDQASRETRLAAQPDARSASLLPPRPETKQGLVSDG
ncbi:hypothetical protein [Martelella endophytica]|uniref:hypothetical protein n=1 Tax=Martelella endophytica TaxID=1486262 RepID=UPI000B211D0E|nr:hypothetical protein [Martelella endophytica]